MYYFLCKAVLDLALINVLYFVSIGEALAVKEVQIVQQQTGLQVLDAANDEILKAFLKELSARHIQDRTKAAYVSNIKRFAAWIAANNLPLTRGSMISYAEALRAEVQGGAKKASTAQSYIVAVRQFFAFAEVYTDGRVRNIASGVKAPKTGRGHKKNALTETQVVDMLAGVDTSNLRGMRDFAMLYLMVTCGLRTIEVIRLNKGSIQPKGSGFVLKVWGKGRDDDSDEVNLDADTYATLQRYLAARGSVDNNAPLFISVSPQNYGERMTTRSVSRIAKEAMLDSVMFADGSALRDAEKNISGRYTAHSLRHTTATIDARNGESREAIQQHLRHANPATTQIYIDEIESEKNTCSSTISAALKRARSVA